MPLRFVTLENRRKNSPKLFFTGKFAFFFKILCFQQFHRCNRISPLTSKAIVKIDCRYSQIRPSGLSHSRIGEKTVQNFFSLESLPFFQNFVFSTTSYVLQNWPCNFHSNCQNTLWTLINYPLRFVTLENARKNSPKLFFTGKFAFFFKILCFQQLHRCNRINHVTSTVIVKKLCWPE